ncbi:MAG: HAD-IA family hydrolase [Leptolyngbyaceae bacterium]|nr:HAD-IA family hydrolase [Leptolyngbyaceae bacterium]
MLKAILFDLDGTLTNTDPIHYSVWKNLLSDYDIAVDREFYDRYFSGRLNADIIADLLPQLSPEEGAQFSDRKEALFREHAQTELIRLEGLTEFLDWVDRHHLKRAVVTNAPPKNAWFSLDVLQLRDFFEVVVIGEELEHGKPHPMPYEVGLQKVGVEASEAIAFEDSPSGIRSAVSAGILTVGVASTHEPEALTSAGATSVIKDFQDPVLNTILETHYGVMGRTP